MGDAVGLGGPEGGLDSPPRAPRPQPKFPAYNWIAVFDDYALFDCVAAFLHPKYVLNLRASCKVALQRFHFFEFDKGRPFQVKSRDSLQRLSKRFPRAKEVHVVLEKKGTRNDLSLVAGFRKVTLTGYGVALKSIIPYAASTGLRNIHAVHITPSKHSDLTPLAAVPLVGLTMEKFNPRFFEQLRGVRALHLSVSSHDPIEPSLLDTALGCLCSTLTELHLTLPEGYSPSWPVMPKLAELHMQCFPCWAISSSTSLYWPEISVTLPALQRLSLTSSETGRMIRGMHGDTVPNLPHTLISFVWDDYGHVDDSTAEPIDLSYLPALTHCTLTTRFLGQDKIGPLPATLTHLSFTTETRQYYDGQTPEMRVLLTLPHLTSLSVSTADTLSTTDILQHVHAGVEEVELCAAGFAFLQVLAPQGGRLESQTHMFLPGLLKRLARLRTLTLRNRGLATPEGVAAHLSPADCAQLQGLQTLHCLGRITLHPDSYTHLAHIPDIALDVGCVIWSFYIAGRDIDWALLHDTFVSMGGLDEMVSDAFIINLLTVARPGLSLRLARSPGDMQALHTVLSKLLKATGRSVRLTMPPGGSGWRVEDEVDALPAVAGLVSKSDTYPRVFRLAVL